MIVVPKEKAASEKLNIYYIDIHKLIEHQQGENGAGALHFESNAAEGVVFFDKDDVLDGFFKEKKHDFSGEDAVRRIFEAAHAYNFTVNVHRLPPGKIYFWATLPYAEPTHKNLNSEFNDLEGLMRKLQSEQLTGFIDVMIGDGRESGYLFLNSGEFFGGSYTWVEAGTGDQETHRTEIINKVKAAGGEFNVYRIPKRQVPNANAAQTRVVPKDKPEITSGDEGVIVMLEEFLGIFEGVVASKKGIKTDFKTLLNKKFLENADRYEFLDPFAAEFHYSNRKISLSWDIPEAELAVGVIESVKELAEELNLLPRLLNYVNAWSAKFSKKLEKYCIRF